MDVATDQNWVLSLGVFLPLAGVVLMLFVPDRQAQLHKQIALVTALATFGVAIYTLVQFDYDQAEKLQFFVDTEWIEAIRSNYTMGLDGISLRCTCCPASSRSSSSSTRSTRCRRAVAPRPS